MEEKIIDEKNFETIDRHIEELKKSKGYFVGITILDENDKLKHYFVTDNFPKLDFLPSLVEIKKLVIEDLETPAQDLSKEVFFKT